jgi:hypothetical protein
VLADLMVGRLTTSMRSPMNKSSVAAAMANGPIDWNNLTNSTTKQGHTRSPAFGGILSPRRDKLQNSKMIIPDIDVTGKPTS